MAARFQYTPAGGSTLSHRAALVPPASEAGGSSGRSSPFGAYSSARTAEELESQNDDALDGLSAKVKMLKDITVGIGNEVRDSGKLIAGMNDTFSETGSLLGGTFSRMKKMASKQGGRWWYWMLFLIIVFWIFVFRWMGFL